MSEKEFVAGIDYSLCGPAICINDMSQPFDFHSCQFYFLTTVKKHVKKIKSNIQGESFSDYNQEIQRYETIADWAADKLIGCNHVGLEGYAYNATGKVFHIAENTGVLKYKLYQMSLPVDIITPGEIKKFATGKGNASKEKMYESFFEETGIPLSSLLGMSRQKTEPQKIKSPISDIVDSYFICKFMRYEIIV